MKEVQLSHVWEYQLFDSHALRSIAGDEIRILDQGVLNVNAGPDFIDAQIYIDGVLLVGDVEIHVKSSDYLLHKHEADPAYNKLILHVVYEEDVKLPFLNCPTLELTGRVPLQYLRHLPVKSNKTLYCRSLWNNQTNDLFEVEINKTWRERVINQRQHMVEVLRVNYPFDVKLLYQLLFKVFGQPVNTDAMNLLFSQLPFEKMLGRLSVMDWEAILLGTASFLKFPSDDVYLLQLRDRFRILKERFKIEEIPVSLWRFSRMRPPNFPPVRLIQLAQLCALLPNSFEQLKNKEIENAFQWLVELDITTSLFWQETRVIGEYHIRTSSKLLSRQMKASIFANAFIPYFLARTPESDLHIRIGEIDVVLQQLPAESNHIIIEWNKMYRSIKTMSDTQKVLAQYKTKCLNQRCLDCLVGMSVCRD